jgi:hypothetical protein
MYSLENELINQENLLAQISDFVTSEAQNQELHQVEENLLRKLMELGQFLLREVIARRGDGYVGESVADGGVQRQYKGKRKTTYLSLFGELKIERAYYWQTGVGGTCPLDARLNLPAGKVSYFVQKLFQGRVTEGSYDEALRVMDEFFGLSLNKRIQEKLTRQASAGRDEFYQEKNPFDVSEEGEVIGVSADGKGVRMIPGEKPAAKVNDTPGTRRGKGEKPGNRRMAVATADFTFDPESRTPEEMVKHLMGNMQEKERKEERERQHERRKMGEPPPRAALNVQVSATMRGKEAALRELAVRVQRRDPSGLKRIAVFLDGESALEKRIISAFREAGILSRVDMFVLDIIHASEYLWEAGSALFGETGGKRKRWVKEQLLKLLRGGVGQVIGGLRRRQSGGKLSSNQSKVLKKVIIYFGNHRQMMRYDEALRKGYPIGTGLIEGTCRSLVKDRMDISGAKWCRAGAEAVLRLRGIRKNGDWDDYWEKMITKNLRRLYPNCQN